MDSNTDAEREDNPEIIDKENDVDIGRDDDGGVEMNHEKYGDHEDNVDRNDKDDSAVDGDAEEANDEDILMAGKGSEMDDEVGDTGNHEERNDQDDDRDVKPQNAGNETSEHIDHGLDGIDNEASRVDTRGVEEGRGDDEIDGDGDDLRGVRPIDGVTETQTANDDGDSNETYPTKYDEGENTQQTVAIHNNIETYNDNDIDEVGYDDAGGGGGGGLGGVIKDQGLKDEDVRDADDDDEDPGESASVRTSKISFAEDVRNRSGSPRTDIGDNRNNANIRDSCEQRDGEEARAPHPKLISKTSSGKKSSIGKKSKTVRVRSSKTVSSIEVDMSRIMRSARGGGDVDSDDDDHDDAVTRVTCTKSVDFSLPVDDEVEEELQRVIERPSSGRMSLMDDEALGVGRAATMNTPVTNDDRESFMYARSIRTPSRDGIYEHALDLINNRCRGAAGGSIYSARSQPHAQRRRRKSDPPPRSAASLPATLIGGVPMFDLPNVVEHINQEPFVQQPNSYFYVAQERPLPMQPLKVWKGYRGNVYFEPMTCRKVRMSTFTGPQQINKESSRFPSITKSNGPPATDAPRTPSKSATTARSQTFITQTERERPTRRGTKSALSTRGGNARQLAILDKGSVLNRMDYNTAEDIRWISGIESTGTLQIGANNAGLTGRAYRFYRNGPKHPKLRIRRGLVSHDLATGSKHAPNLGVRGGHINDNGSVVMPQKKASQQTGGGHGHASPGRGHEGKQGQRTVSQSHPSDNYSCVDPMTALREIMNRNDGHGRSKLVHILPSANFSNGAHPTPQLRAKGK